MYFRVFLNDGKITVSLDCDVWDEFDNIQDALNFIYEWSLLSE